MMAPEDCHQHVLKPYDVREGMSLAQAAERAGKSESTLRAWCVQRGLGRRVGGGVWVVSRVALAMFLDGDVLALAAYQTGDRSSDLVTSYFERFGLARQTPELDFLSPFLSQATRDAVAKEPPAMRAGLMLASPDFMYK